MGSKTRLSSYCTKRANNGVNLVTSRKINTRLARPIVDLSQLFTFILNDTSLILSGVSCCSFCFAGRRKVYSMDIEIKGTC